MSNVPLPEPDGVIAAMWNVVRHGPNYDGRQNDVIAAAKAYAERHAAAVSAAKDKEIERLRADVAGLREDAERYRWLRDKLDVSDQATWNIFMSEGVEQWDAAIDAARKGEA